MLQNGANPDLHDEEGRTALDKARERNEEGHQQVVQILESPTSHMMDNFNAKRGALADKLKDDDGSTTGSEIKASNQKIDQHNIALAMSILKQLVPVFCDIFQV